MLVEDSRSRAPPPLNLSVYYLRTDYITTPVIKLAITSRLDPYDLDLSMSTPTCSRAARSGDLPRPRGSGTEYGPSYPFWSERLTRRVLRNSKRKTGRELEERHLGHAGARAGNMGYRPRRKQAGAKVEGALKQIPGSASGTSTHRQLLQPYAALLS